MINGQSLLNKSSHSREKEKYFVSKIIILKSRPSFTSTIQSKFYHDQVSRSPFDHPSSGKLKLFGDYFKISFLQFGCMFLTNKRIDVWSRDFIIWKINSGLWAVLWAGLWKNRGWANYEQLLRPVFSLFRGQKKIIKFLWKHYSIRTEKLHNNF